MIDGENDSSANTSSGLAMLGSSNNLGVLPTFLPQRSHIHALWLAFLKNVNPVFPIIHCGKTASSILQDAQGLGHSKSHAALKAVIYFSAITSMTPEEITLVFGAQKSSLLAHSRSSAECALAQADASNTTDLTTLQALVLFIICLRRRAPTRHIWTLVGVALRAAFALGLQRDGSTFGRLLSPYQIEMRRRLWWQLYILELRAAEDQGCEPTLSRESFDTHLPLNIEDEDLPLGNGIFQGPHARHGFTHMTFGLVCYETALLGQAMQPSRFAHDKQSHSHAHVESSSMASKLLLIDACEEKLQKEYLLFTCVQTPITLLGRVFARFALARLRLVVQSPFTAPSISSIPCLTHQNSQGATREQLFLLSIAIVEDSIFMNDEPSLNQWNWAARKYIPWHPLALILTELYRREPSLSLTQRAWRAVDGVLRSCEPMSHHLGELPSNAAKCDERDAALWRLITTLITRAKKEPGSRAHLFDVNEDVGPLGQEEIMENYNNDIDIGWNSSSILADYEKEFLTYTFV
jgi:hypothetical protein